MTAFEQHLREQSLDAKTQLLLTDPVALVGHSKRNWEHLPRAEVEAMQLRGLQQRFAQLRDQIPMLKKLADGQGIEHIDCIDDVVPLLFEHTMYKSYPPSLLDNNKWAQIAKWMGKLVTPDIAASLAAADYSACEGLDDFFEVVGREVPQLRLGHSSGTSGTISFLPHSVSEAIKSTLARRLFIWDMDGPVAEPPELHVAYPYFRRGYATHLRGNDYTVKYVLKGEEYFHAAYPTLMSSDVLYLGAKIRAAQAKGTLDRLTISPKLRAKKAEYDKLLADMPQHLENFFQTIAEELKGKRIFVWGTWNLLHGMATAGLKHGLEGVFAADSFINTGGGAKGLEQPPGWREDILRFTGARRLHELYGMTEVLASHFMCEHGNYHLAPTAVPYLLDPETSQPLPREGRVTGRAAFFDLGADSRWGGFITGDEITIDWSTPCGCGRPSAYVLPLIQRYSELQGGDDKITCAASANVHAEAMDFLNNFDI